MAFLNTAPTLPPDTRGGFDTATNAMQAYARTIAKSYQHPQESEAEWEARFLAELRQCARENRETLQATAADPNVGGPPRKAAPAVAGSVDAARAAFCDSLSTMYQAGPAWAG